MKHLTTYNKFNESKFDDFKQDIKDICLELTDTNKFRILQTTLDIRGRSRNQDLNKFYEYQRKFTNMLQVIAIKSNPVSSTDDDDDEFSTGLTNLGFKLNGEVLETVLRLIDFLETRYLKIGIFYLNDEDRQGKIHLFDSIEEIDDKEIESLLIYHNTNGGTMWTNEKLTESKSETTSKLKFIKQPKKKGAKTDTYNVSNGGKTIGQVKWSSRMRGYAFLPTKECELEIKEFMKELMRKRREDK
jgi:hypothetical protein